MAAGAVKVSFGTSLASPLTTLMPRSTAVAGDDRRVVETGDPVLPVLDQGQRFLLPVGRGNQNRAGALGARDGTAGSEQHAVVLAEHDVEVLLGDEQVFHRLQAAFVVPGSPALADHGDVGLAVFPQLGLHDPREHAEAPLLADRIAFLAREQGDPDRLVADLVDHPAAHQRPVGAVGRLHLGDEVGLRVQRAVDDDHLHALGTGVVDGVHHAVDIGRVDDQQLHAAGHQVFDVGDLLLQLALGVGADHLVAELGRAGLGRFHLRREVRCRQRLHRNADLEFAGVLGHRVAAQGEQGRGGQGAQ